MGEIICWTLTFRDTNYGMQEQPDVNWTGNNLKIFPLTFIWHKLDLNTSSHFKDSASVTLHEFSMKWHTKTRTECDTS